MCGGGQPRAPKIVYQGPSDADIKRQQDSLDAFRETMQTNQATFQSTLQDQIDTANEETAALQAQFDDDLASLNQANDEANAKTAAGYASESSSAAALASAEMASYSTAAKQTEMPEGAQTTAAVTDKKKPKKSLKISTAGTASKAGSGLNIGV
jgi:peptidoglycan hydrolase CwlO-like protein